MTSRLAILFTRAPEGSRSPFSKSPSDAGGDERAHPGSLFQKEALKEMRRFTASSVRALLTKARPAQVLLFFFVLAACAPPSALAQTATPASDSPAQVQPAEVPAASTPTETVRAFYKALAERRFR